MTPALRFRVIYERNCKAFLQFLRSSLKCTADGSGHGGPSQNWKTKNPLPGVQLRAKGEAPPKRDRLGGGPPGNRHERPCMEVSVKPRRPACPASAGPHPCPELNTGQRVLRFPVLRGTPMPRTISSAFQRAKVLRGTEWAHIA